MFQLPPPPPQIRQLFRVGERKKERVLGWGEVKYRCQFVNLVLFPLGKKIGGKWQKQQRVQTEDKRFIQSVPIFVHIKNYKNGLLSPSLRKTYLFFFGGGGLKEFVRGLPLPKKFEKWGIFVFKFWGHRGSLFSRHPLLLNNFNWVFMSFDHNEL